jgi:sugar lactone lactonase YvrE
MRYLSIYAFLALTFAAAAGAQIVLDPSPARVLGHPSITPAEQLVVTNINPNFVVNGGMYNPEGVALDTTGSTPILYVADTWNNRILAWKNATSSTLTNLQAPDLIIGQPNSHTTLPAINGGLSYPTGLVVDAKGNLYVADSGNNRVLRYPAPFANNNASPDIVIGQPDKYTSNSTNQRYLRQFVRSGCR